MKVTKPIVSRREQQMVRKGSNYIHAGILLTVAIIATIVAAGLLIGYTTNPDARSLLASGLVTALLLALPLYLIAIPIIVRTHRCAWDPPALVGSVVSKIKNLRKLQKQKQLQSLLTAGGYISVGC